MADFGGNLLISSNQKTLNGSFLTNVPIILAVDNIAQEGTERGILRMRIPQDSDRSPNTFFKKDLAVTIIGTSSE